MSRIKFSSEIPPKVLIDNPQLLKLLDYDFVIASMYLDDAAYRNYYLSHQRAGVILDNGAFETGESIPVSDYIRVIDELRPAIIVLPDVRQDCNKTHLRVEEFAAFKIFEDYKADYKFMGALQGKSYAEWRSLLSLYQDLAVDIIGIPYGTLDRISFIRNHPEVKFHALGLQYFPELLSLRLLKNVVSIDTSLPVKYAANQKLLRDLDPITIDERPSFGKGFNSRQMAYLIMNLEFIQEVCDRTNNFPLV